MLESEGFSQNRHFCKIWSITTVLILFIVLPSFGFDFFSIGGWFIIIMALILLNLVPIAIFTSDAILEQEKQYLTPARAKTIIWYRNIALILSAASYLAGFLATPFFKGGEETQGIFLLAFILSLSVALFVYFQAKNLAKICPFCGSIENSSERIPDSEKTLSYNKWQHEEKLTCKKCKCSWGIIVATERISS